MWSISLLPVWPPMTVFTDHSAVQAILNAPKHTRWGSIVYGSGVGGQHCLLVSIVYTITD